MTNLSVNPAYISAYNSLNTSAAMNSLQNALPPQLTRQAVRGIFEVSRFSHAETTLIWNVAWMAGLTADVETQGHWLRKIVRFEIKTNELGVADQVRDELKKFGISSEVKPR